METPFAVERPLRAHEREVVRAALETVGVASPIICDRAVVECVLVRRKPEFGEVRGLRSAIAYMALRSRASGITMGRRVFIREELYDADGGLPVDLVAHEVAHVAQFLRDGVPGFLARYVVDYVRGLATGLPDMEAYLAIPYEVEARRVAAALETPDIQAKIINFPARET